MSSKEKWNHNYSQSDIHHIAANEVLLQNAHLLPTSGKALDLACGLGGNALLLSAAGFDTHAWDISTVALDRLRVEANKAHLEISFQERDVEKNPPGKNSFDVIVVGHFLHRQSFKGLINALRAEGLLFYQTFTKARVNQNGPSNPDYLLEKNELLNRCEDMTILVYREEDLQGDLNQGWRNQAMVVAQKFK